MTNLVALKIGSQYGVLTNQLLRFDPQFNISIEDQGDLVIRFDKNSDYIPKFFGNQVSYVTGLVGKNGVGKSTLLRYVKELFIQERTDLRDRENDVIIYLEDQILKVYINENRKSEVIVINNSHIQKDEKIYYRNYPKLFDRVKNFTTVYYSNNLDLGQKEVETKNFYNISTSFLLENSGKINSRIRNRRITGLHSRFKFTELKRQLEFLNEFDSIRKKLKIPFKRIDRLEIEVTEVLETEYRKLLYNVHAEFNKRGYVLNAPEFEEVNFIAPRDVKEFLDYFSSNLKELEYAFSMSKRDYRSGSNYFIAVIIIENLLFQLLKQILSDKTLLTLFINDRHSQEDIFDPIFRFAHKDRWDINGNNFEHLISQTIHYLEKKHFKRDDINAQKIQKQVDELRRLWDFEKFIFDFISHGEIEYNKVSYNTQDPRISNILSEYFSSNLNFKFINFSWPRLSAGEESLIAFFSRLNSLIKDINSENLLLIIDEGDLYFHPEWQREYIYFLLRFFKTMTKEISNIQIILTTHSPFLVSDLPTENIILLSRKDENSEVRIIDARDVNLETFGGNIHTLYSKAFFLGFSTTSEFAMNKIKTEIVNPLQGTKTVNKDQIRRLINKIGEPVLKSALLKQLNEYPNG